VSREDWQLVDYDVEHHGSLDSTNRRARELAVEGADRVVVAADEQTGGRGRRGRSWRSPQGGIYLSIVRRPGASARDAPLFTLAAAVGVARAARERGVEARIKWPNDVVVGRGKLAGVLTESATAGDALAWVIVGVGVNVVAPGVEGATGLGEHAAREDVDRPAFVADLLAAFDRVAGDSGTTLSAWRELSDTLGRRVRVETPGGEVVGEAVDVDPPGTLVVETATGRRRVAVGDCEHLRPVGGSDRASDNRR
jgi:BirA family biotin operon repressor/biotin-[acetyl-CoA-carboxylase] ligase